LFLFAVERRIKAIPPTRLRAPNGRAGVKPGTASRNIAPPWLTSRKAPASFTRN
jgi:hypothetical protein